MVNYGLLSQSLLQLPINEMNNLVDGVAPNIGVNELGKVYTYSWDDLKIVCFELNEEENLNYLNALISYVDSLCSHKKVPNDSKNNIVSRILKTKLTLRVEIECSNSQDARIEDFIGKLCFGLQPIIFYDYDLFDQNSALILSSRSEF